MAASGENKRVIAIGDVHGCAAELALLIDKIAPRAADQLVFLGDYVDRGPDSRGTLDLLFALPERCRVVTLLGNHDRAMLAAVDGQLEVDQWRDIGGGATLQSYGDPAEVAGIPAEHVDFLRRCPMWHELSAHFFVHGNYMPELPLDEQPEDMLMWTSLREYVPGPHMSGKVAVVGHTPQNDNKVLDLGHLVCIDTGCCYGGSLTALEIHTGQTWQVKSSQPRDPRW